MEARSQTVANKSIRASFVDSSTDTAESDDGSSQETAEEVAASKVSKPQENQAAKSNRATVVTYYSMTRKNDLPDFFLISDSQSPALQTLSELKQLSLDKSVLRKAEVVYSQLYITTEKLYTLMNELFAAE
ncbi:Hypothetical predicted protein [Cloeon dipterum]|uniref:Uncharacterized protein n=1 Tax=Cloeon dipterum TaxID=197152 RepID=A0A8S1E894_9INSE|nr:Hypothetical predicted protein [Cloeon dipterum]